MVLIAGGIHHLFNEQSAFHRRTQRSRRSQYATAARHRSGSLGAGGAAQRGGGRLMQHGAEVQRDAAKDRRHQRRLFLIPGVGATFVTNITMSSLRIRLRL